MEWGVLFKISTLWCKRFISKDSVKNILTLLLIYSNNPFKTFLCFLSCLKFFFDIISDLTSKNTSTSSLQLFFAILREKSFCKLLTIAQKIVTIGITAIVFLIDWFRDKLFFWIKLMNFTASELAVKNLTQKFWSNKPN